MIKILVLLTMLAFAEPQVAWQLGVCVDSGCLSIGRPQPEAVCKAMRDAMANEGIRRVVCARVLVDD